MGLGEIPFLSKMRRMTYSSRNAAGVVKCLFLLSVLVFSFKPMKRKLKQISSKKISFESFIKHQLNEKLVVVPKL